MGRTEQEVPGSVKVTQEASELSLGVTRNGVDGERENAGALALGAHGSRLVLIPTPAL